MAALTNAELKAKIAELAQDLGIEPPEPERVNNASLRTVVADLEARLAEVRGRNKTKAVEGDTDKDALGGPPPPPKAEEQVPDFEFYITANHAVTSPRGQLTEFVEVRRGDFPADVLEDLMKKGAVAHNPGASKKHGG